MSSGDRLKDGKSSGDQELTAEVTQDELDNQFDKTTGLETRKIVENGAKSGEGGHFNM